MRELTAEQAFVAPAFDYVYPMYSRRARGQGVLGRGQHLRGETGPVGVDERLQVRDEDLPNQTSTVHQAIL